MSIFSTTAAPSKYDEGQQKAGQFTNTQGIPHAQVEVLTQSATKEAEEARRRLGSPLEGLDEEQVEAIRALRGPNELAHEKPTPVLVQYAKAYLNPFILILILLTSIMLMTDVVFADPDEGADITGVVTISIMVVVSASLRFWQEYRTAKDIAQLKAMVRVTAAVTRCIDGQSVTREIPIEEIVPGDIVQLAAGDMIPADVRFLRTKDLEVNQSMLSGEALPAQKSAAAEPHFEIAAILDAKNLGFMGTSVASGSATAVVVGTGSNSYFGGMASAITGHREETTFDRGIKKVTFTLIKFMVVMVPVVFIVNGITKNWTEAFLFGVTTAVGLTPEMLPLIVTATLAKGARLMARHKVIVKRLNAIQDLGAMDILCTDKTGTLTEDRIVLQSNLDGSGNACPEALRYGALNAHFQTGLRNLLDEAVLTAGGRELTEAAEDDFTMIDEMPFDFSRRRMSVVLEDHSDGRRIIVTKGAVEEVLSVCTSEIADGRVRELTPGRTANIDYLVAQENGRGMRVLAVAVKSAERDVDEYSREDESAMTLVGLLTFLDPPKESAAGTIESLRKHGTDIKVVTGDNPLVAATVCEQVGIEPGRIVMGAETEGLSDQELSEICHDATVFAKVNPMQKARIVRALRTGDHTVGFMGDGINDAPALRAADVGISVDTAVDVAKEAADLILLEKDLRVLEGGVLEGRRTYVNTMKYIKMTASSNYGNMFSVLVASAMLPFLPMVPLVVLVQNLAYDLSMLTLPWDKVDAEDIAKPRKWDASSLQKFMLRIGPISSIFDITTFALMWWVFAANTPEQASLFQSGWFIESIISQTLIVHMIRTKRVPFIQSRASLPVLLATGAVCVFGMVLPFTGWGAALGLVALPWSYFPWLVLTLAAYCMLTQFAKKQYLETTDVWI